MDTPFRVGDVVLERESTRRMKVVSLDKADGSVRCSWVRGPAKLSKSFAVSELQMCIPKARSTS
ncbi:hypothetical protein [Solimonas marina]|uniref:DUF2158 domain-containing protein n=1 Tax=Solimonas marina TaxID=2714601 RepID=A0A969W7Z6_9GAMM|nr:hypothetical protein [Solimonas marina]NKF22092.1 hypothetical protein [Solimonas marina]